MIKFKAAAITGWILLIILFIIPCSLNAQTRWSFDPPHVTDPWDSDQCLNCHLMESDYSGLLPLPRGAEQAALCQTCHNPTGLAAAMSDVGNHVVVHSGDNQTIDCSTCHDPHAYQESTDPHTGISADNLKLIRTEVSTDLVSEVLNPIIFQERPDHFAFSEGAAPYTGVCQACHTETNYHTNNGSGDYAHWVGSECTSCHLHSDGFTPEGHAGAGGTGCESCHGTSGSHLVHLTDTSTGPGELECSDCHDTSNFPYFSDGKDLAATTVCDACHSPGGDYDGVNDPVYGAKPNWKYGVYHGDVLSKGRDKWCAGCHDSEPSVILGITAPNIVGDETADTYYGAGTGYGYYKTGHGLPTTDTFSFSGGIIPGPGLMCVECHDNTMQHIDGVANSYDEIAGEGDNSVLDGDGKDYQYGYRLRSVNQQYPMKIPRKSSATGGISLESDVFLCIKCHDSELFFDPDNRDTNFRSDTRNAHYYHLTNSGMVGRFDSSWGDGSNESWPTCATCHNVHGSSQLSMIRDGRLVGREPGLPIAYYNDSVVFNSGIPDSYSITLDQSTGVMFNGNEMSNLCSNCHGGGWEFDLYSPYLRTPNNYANINDSDGDGAPDASDSCPVTWQATQVGSDSDGDGWGDVCDICPDDPTNTNDTTNDTDHDGIGDTCDACPADVLNDADGDGLCGSDDLCPYDPQNDADGDDVCDDIDNCLGLANGPAEDNQQDTDEDLVGDACDNCIFDQNYNQADSDGDGIGDACDESAVVPMISGGQLHTIALKSDGTVWAWGEDTYGQLGGYVTTEQCMRDAVARDCSKTPVQVQGEGGVGYLENISAISTNPFGAHNLALDNNGNVWAWGNNSYGQLGNGTTGGFSSTPVQVLNMNGTAPLSNIISISAGAAWSLAVRDDGTVWAWGSDEFGNIGNGASRADTNLPVQVKIGNNSNQTLGNLLDITKVSTGQSHSLALKDDGTVWTWGNVNDRRADPDPARGYWQGFQAMEATDYPGYLYTNTTAMTGGEKHSSVIDGGTLYTWGTYNNYYSHNLAGTTDVIAVEASAYAHFALKTDGTVWFTGIDTGNGGTGCGGHGTPWYHSHSTPYQVSGEGGVGVLTDIISIDTGEFHGVAIRDNGDGTYSYLTWGYNVSGMLGNGTTTNSWSPIEIVLP